MKTLIATLLGLAGMIAGSTAAENTQARLVFLGVGESLADVRIAEGSPGKAFDITTTALSAPVDYSGPATLSLRVPKGGTPTVSCALPPGADTILVIATTRAAEEDEPESASEDAPETEGVEPEAPATECVLSAHDLSEARVKPGGFLWVNLLDEATIAIAGEEELPLKAGGDAPYHPEDQGGMILAKLRQVTAEGERPGRILFSSSWPPKPAQRSVVVISEGSSRAHPVLVSRFLEAAR